jgi:hypothetical protein
MDGGWMHPQFFYYLTFSFLNAFPPQCQDDWIDIEEEYVPPHHLHILPPEHLVELWSWLLAWYIHFPNFSVSLLICKLTPQQRFMISLRPSP